ncbi:MAG: ABC transporter ATP-binding protein, partial [Actinomycetota bacterium]|nr:ABC transporter ATP-binding protein [Actinomycetota bacterium]
RKQMQLELKRIQDEVGVTFVHVTHDQDEAMTMADAIAVMNAGRIEQVGTAAELYERPRSAFVAGFLGVSNLLSATAVSAGVVRLDTGVEVRVADGALDGRRGRVAVGVRPEKIGLTHAASSASPDDRAGQRTGNVLQGVVTERSYVGVATEFIVETPPGRLTVYAQNAAPGERHPARGERVALSWSPEATFVVDVPDDLSGDGSPEGGSP